MKIAPLVAAIRAQIKEGKELAYELIHTGQHYDKLLSESFFEELNIPEPDVNLRSGSGTQAEQTAAIMIGLEKHFTHNPTDLVLVVGDVTSTLAAGIVAKKLGLKLAHVEAGIRSYDMAMPEEINRLVTDAISDYFFTTTQWATENLLRSGIDRSRIFLVGNTMIDTLLANKERFSPAPVFDSLRLQEKEYFVLTLHRPNNVDDPGRLSGYLETIAREAGDKVVIFPAHPRTAKMLEQLPALPSNLHVTQPLSYLNFMHLVQHAFAVLTDSGGVQEETTVLNVPCLTLRDNTERPETTEIGTNELVGTVIAAIPPAMEKLRRGEWKTGSVPELWDGNTAERIVNLILDKVNNK